MAIADNMWRFTMQCIGGQGVVVIALSLGLFGRAVDSSLYSSEGRSEHVIPNIMQTARFIVRFSAAFIIIGTVVLSLLCFFVGMEPLRAFFNGLWLSVASFNTGGMASMSPGILYYHSGLIELVVMVLILLGSINFTLHSEVWKGRIDHFFKDIEIRTLAIWLSIVVAAFVAALCTANLYDELPTLLRRGSVHRGGGVFIDGIPDHQREPDDHGGFERRAAHHRVLHGHRRIGGFYHGRHQGDARRYSR